jgi:DNA-binding CsgD family transcriptional regulator
MPEKALAQIYGLTWSEARLLSAIAAGQSLADYAQIAWITIETARFHSKNVLAKTGHRRQIDLIREIAASPAIKLAGRHIRCRFGHFQA